jgi:pimeloyl-ACP methyl ester carboxylesterase
MELATPTHVGQRVRLSHHEIELDDGHRVGVSIGGAGVPLVFLHGLGLRRRAYLRMLSRVAGLGFLVVAIDAPGHGDTHDLPAGEFTDRVRVVLRTLDKLGVGKAVVAGHSMGGRMAIEIAALAPERVLATVLFDAAAGAQFDAAVRTVMRSPSQMLHTVAGALYELSRDPLYMKVEAMGRYLQMLRVMLMGKAMVSNGFCGAARALMQSGDSSALLKTLHRLAVPTIVLHGADDAIIPFETAREAAADAGAVLYKIPRACHSWLIAEPDRGAGAVRQLLAGELGQVLREVAGSMSIADWRDVAEWEAAILGGDAQVCRLRNHDLIGPEDVCDVVQMERVCPGVPAPAEIASGITA